MDNQDNPTSPIDLGCGWLHSADRNPWRTIAEAQGYSIDMTPPPWTRPSSPIGFSLPEQASFFEAVEEFMSPRYRFAGGPRLPGATD